MSDIQFSVFTKPWRTLSLTQLAEHVKQLGFDGVEFPLREGFQVEPSHAEKGLPQMTRLFKEFGLQVFSVASEPKEEVFAACAEAGVPVIRIMPRIQLNEGYLNSEAAIRRSLEDLTLLSEKYGVQVGVQQHCGHYITDSFAMMRVLEDLNPAHTAAIWDSAHDALAGQQPEYGLEVVWDRLCMVNFKNAFYRRISGPEAEAAEWKVYYTSGRQGLASWPRAAQYLKDRQYAGVVCLTAEYSDESQLERLIAEDIRYAKSLFLTA